MILKEDIGLWIRHSLQLRLASLYGVPEFGCESEQYSQSLWSLGVKARIMLQIPLTNTVLLNEDIGLNLSVTAVD